MGKLAINTTFKEGNTTLKVEMSDSSCNRCFYKDIVKKYNLNSCEMFHKDCSFGCYRYLNGKGIFAGLVYCTVVFVKQ